MPLALAMHEAPDARSFSRGIEEGRAVRMKESLGVSLNAWERFLNSLATRGGNILTLFWLWVVIGIAMIVAVVVQVIYKIEVNAQVLTVFISTFSSLTGALIALLQGGQSRQRGGDSPEAGGQTLSFTGKATLSGQPGAGEGGQGL